MQIVGLIGGPATGFDGQYVLEYDPERDGVDDEGRPMFAHLVTTPDIDRALVFESGAQAMDTWRKVCEREPRRADGQPNRPLTAFTVEIVRVL